MKKAIAIILAVIIAGAVCTYFSCNYKKEIKFESNKYSSFKVSDFGDYQDLYCQENKSGTIVFSSYSDLVIASYSEESFHEQLNSINAKYTFLNDAVFEEDSDSENIEREKGKKYYLIPDNHFTIKNWSFDVIEGEAYPHYIDIIGYNEKTFQIAYLSFFDSDIDYICEYEENENNDYMPKFIKKYFKYNFE